MEEADRITVLLADDHRLVREGIRALLATEDDIEVVGEARDGRRAVDLARSLHPAVVLMDISMPLLNGIEATRQILRTDPSTRVLVLSAHNDESYVEQVAAMGGAGYLVKQSSADQLADAIRDVHAGRSVYRAGSPPEGREHVPASLSRLTSRETEVLQLIAEGKANKEVAAELGISIKTVEKHRHNLMRKLSIHDTAGLTRYAIAAGIIDGTVKVAIE